MGNIVQAVISGDLQAVRYELAHGVSANTIGQDGLYLVHLAAMANHPDIFQVLVQNHATVDAFDHHHNTPLYYAARHGGSSQFIQDILNAGATIGNQNKIGQSAAHIAARIGNVEALQTLLKNGADLNQQDILGKSPLHDAVKTNHAAEALILIEYGANTHLKDKYNATPISLAEKASSEIQALFSLPILDSIQVPKHHALFEATIANDFEGVKQALDNGAWASTGNAHGFTGMHYAALHGNVEILKLYAAHGAEIIQTTDEGMQAIHIGAMANESETVSALLDLGATANAVDNHGNTPLHYASHYADGLEVVQVLLDAGGLLDTVNNQGDTALHLAAAHGSLEVVKLLVSHHADVSIENNKGETALQEATLAHHDDIVAFLSEPSGFNLFPLNSQFHNEALFHGDIIKSDDFMTKLLEPSPGEAMKFSSDNDLSQAITFIHQEDLVPIPLVEHSL